MLLLLYYWLTETSDKTKTENFILEEVNRAFSVPGEDSHLNDEIIRKLIFELSMTSFKPVLAVLSNTFCPTQDFLPCPDLSI